MITVNKGNNSIEQITEKEFIHRYPEVHKALHEPRDLKSEGERLKKIREKYNATIEEIANKHGFLPMELIRIEQGKDPATTKIVDAYGMLEIKK